MTTINEYNIKYNHNIEIFEQKVDDDRNIPRKFELIDDKILYSHFLHHLYVKQIHSVPLEEVDY